MQLLGRVTYEGFAKVVDPGSLVETVAQLKREGDGDILVAGSATLAQALAAHGLVDEYHLMVHPIALGAGKRLCDAPVTLRLIDSTVFGSGSQILTYAPARD